MACQKPEVDCDDGQVRVMNGLILLEANIDPTKRVFQVRKLISEAVSGRVKLLVRFMMVYYVGKSTPCNARNIQSFRGILTG